MRTIATSTCPGEKGSLERRGIFNNDESDANVHEEDKLKVPAPPHISHGTPNGGCGICVGWRPG